VRWLLTWLLPPDERRVVLGELEELYRLRRARDGEPTARAWLGRQLAQYPYRLLLERLRPRRSPAGASPARQRTDSSGGAMRDLTNDLRHGLRSLARTPSLAVTVVLTVGLGLGATTAMFAALHAVLLAPLPYAQPDRLVRIYTDAPPHRWPFSVADYLALDEQQTSFARVAGYTSSNMAFHRGQVAERLRGRLVTWGYFSLLGIRPELGRVFARSDSSPDAGPMVVVSHGFWQRELGADEAAVGRSVRLDGVGYRVVGVLPADVGPLERGRDYFALARWPTPPRRGPFFITALGRLGPGVSRAAAAAELRAIDKRLFPVWKDSFQSSNASWGAMDLRRQVVGDVGPTLTIVLAAVGLMLLIACTNAANLLLARAAQRRREIAIRGALGASRGRLLRHLVVESSLLALAAGGVGLALAAAGVRLLRTAGAGYIPRAQEIALDAPVLAFLAAAAAVAGLLFGLLPALSAARSRFDRALACGGRSATGAPAARRARRWLVAGQFAVATPLLIASALLVASLVELQGVDPGFDTGNLLTASLLLPADRYPDRAATDAFWKRAERRIEALPGVRGVALADGRPPADVSQMNNFDLEDHPTPPGEPQPSTPWVSVTPGYFRLMGMPLLRGRGFDERDARPDAPDVAIVDRAWAERYLPGIDPVGRRLHGGGDSAWTTIVGEVATVKYGGLDQPDPGTVYWPMAERSADFPFDRLSSRFAFLVVRTSADPGSLAPAIRKVVRDLDPALPLSDVATQDEILKGALEVPRLLSLLVGAFAAAALLLSVIGIYGVLSYFVQQSSREIGIRIALGGRPASVRRMVVGQGLRLVGTGLAIGLAGALVLTRFLRSLLFGVGATDPSTFAGVAAAMLALAFLACLLPARRAAGVDPVTALRSD
jgi:putative ABC transport system permease protein